MSSTALQPWVKTSPALVDWKSQNEGKTSPSKSDTRTFVVYEAKGEQLEAIATIAANWSAKAAKLYKKAKENSEKANFENCHVLGQRMNNCITTPIFSDPHRRVFVCYDSKKVAQSLMFIRLLFKRNQQNCLVKFVEVECLLTNPENIRSKLNVNSKTRITGSGAAMVMYVCRVALRDNLPIYAEAIPDAEIFWHKKMHFEKAPIPCATGFNSYVLTIEKMRQLAVYGISPYVHILGLFKKCSTPANTLAKSP